MLLSVIVLNWNNVLTTIPTVKKVMAWRSLQPVIWVVDNDSRDDSAARIHSECPGVHLLESDRNLGFAGGNNLAIQQALLEDRTEFILLLNNDAEIEEPGTRQLIATARQHPADIVGPILRDPPPNATLQSAGGRNVAWHVDTHLRAIPSGTQPYPVDYVPGTAILIRANVFQSIGLLDERYFFSGEIADFCRRARRGGARLLIDPRVTAYHDTGKSTELRLAFYAYYVLRNRFLFVRKFYAGWRWLLIPRWTLFGLVSVAAAWRRGEPRRARALWLGLRHGLAGQFGDRNADVLALN